MSSDTIRGGRLRPGGGQLDAVAPGQAGTVAALYEAHALGLVRLAHVMLGDRAAAEDVVQEAFCGLYRRWGSLASTERALSYVRSCVLNGCRSALRHRRRHGPPGGWPDPEAGPDGSPSAEALALHGEDARALLRAVQSLPHRQREAVVLRYYLDLPEAEIAAVMGISPGSVRSATSRALKVLGQRLENLR